ncbi:MAG: WD40 repeat domain-containing protein [Geitlerinemataceae cyanobacterium]
MPNRSKQAALTLLGIAVGFWTISTVFAKVAFSTTVRAISQSLSPGPRVLSPETLSRSSEALFQKGGSLKAGGNAILDVAFDSTGRFIATGTDSLTVWHRDGTPIASITDDESLSFKQVGFSPDGTLIAAVRTTPDESFDAMITSKYRTVELWKFDGDELQHFQTLPHGEWVEKVEFSPNGKSIATVGRDRTIKVWNTNGWQLKNVPGVDFSFSADGNTIATTGTDGTVTLWQVRGWLLQPIREISHEVPITRVSFSPIDDRLATTSDDGTIFLWSRDGEAIAQLKGHDSAVNRLQFSADGRWMTTAGSDGQVRLWHLDGLTVSTFDGYDAFFSPDSRFVAIDDGNSAIGVWNLDTWQRQSIAKPRYSYGGFHFSPDGKTLAVTDNFDVQLWDVQIERR